MRRTPPALLTAAALAVAATVAFTSAPAAAETRDVCFPVEGGAAAAPWTDSYGNPRSGGRTHEGQDLMSSGGRKDRRLLAATDGTVRQVLYDNARGNRVVVQDDAGWYYVYLHVNNDTPGTDDGGAAFDQAFAPGLAEGQRVSRCQFLAFIGDSGNAESSGSQLHFEIRQPLPDGHQYAGRTDPWVWSYATPINPADSLHSATAASNDEASAPATGRWAPFDSVDALVDRQYRDFYGRAADAAGADYWENRLASGADTPSSFISRLLSSPEFTERIAPVARLYWAYFDRIPDTEGLQYWIAETSRGTTLGEVSQAFAASGEFGATYGSLDDGDFVELVYRNVLARTADEEGRRYWTESLTSGVLTRGQVMIGFSESREYRAATASRVRVVLAYVAMLGRSPDEAGLDHWTQRDASELVGGIYASAEYRARIERDT